MRLQLLCVSRRPAAWAADATDEYLKRLQGRLDLKVRELPPAQGVANATQQREREADAVFKAHPERALLVALDERGKAWSTAELANELAEWQQEGRDVTLVIGGAEGLDPRVRERAERVWSLSRLTLPHQMVRVIVVEQIYRAWSMLNRHPYHRA
ncbi:MAG: 23S rRNA (pseudouridine(1915)-N(3))-methyltransferase RlmH [Gammaproteobacteria bacterium]|nr:23S rRNA (pseudouridine(1915)-N(3))-methyltransferase RlmH [Gammaproteobacteria bacterium]